MHSARARGTLTKAEYPAADVTPRGGNVHRMDFQDIAVQMPLAVPMVGTMNVEFLELTPNRVLLRLPDQRAFHNHIGGPHAGAMFTLAETATGALVLGNFGSQLHRATPLAVDASIRYKRIAMGPLYAEAVMSESSESILASLDAGQRPQWSIEVSLYTEDEKITGEASFVWTLKPNRSNAAAG